MPVGMHDGMGSSGISSNNSPGNPGSSNSIGNVPMPIHQALMWARQQDGAIEPLNDTLYNWRLLSTV